MMTMDRPTDKPVDTLDIHEVAALLGVHEQTIYRMIRRGDLNTLPKNPHVRRQSRLLFDRAYVERLARGEIADN